MENAGAGKTSSPQEALTLPASQCEAGRRCYEAERAAHRHAATDWPL
jgi:hypothetical protein